MRPSVAQFLCHSWASCDGGDDDNDDDDDDDDNDDDNNNPDGDDLLHCLTVRWQ